MRLNSRMVIFPPVCFTFSLVDGLIARLLIILQNVLQKPLLRLPLSCLVTCRRRPPCVFINSSEREKDSEKEREKEKENQTFAVASTPKWSMSTLLCSIRSKIALALSALLVTVGAIYRFPFAATKRGCLSCTSRARPMLQLPRRLPLRQARLPRP